MKHLHRNFADCVNDQTVLVGVLSPVNDQGLYQGWLDQVFCSLFTSSKTHMPSVMKGPLPPVTVCTPSPSTATKTGSPVTTFPTTETMYPKNTFFSHIITLLRIHPKHTSHYVTVPSKNNVRTWWIINTISLAAQTAATVQWLYVILSVHSSD